MTNGPGIISHVWPVVRRKYKGKKEKLIHWGVDVGLRACFYRLNLHHAHHAFGEAIRFEIKRQAKPVLVSIC